MLFNGFKSSRLMISLYIARSWIKAVYNIDIAKQSLDSDGHPPFLSSRLAFFLVPAECSGQVMMGLASSCAAVREFMCSCSMAKQRNYTSKVKTAKEKHLLQA